MRDFYIGFDGNNKTWKIFITHAQNEKPSMKKLEEIFGVKHIASFVHYIPEQIKEVTGNSRFLRKPRTGDALENENESSNGTIGAICVGEPDKESHYAITAYHVCYNRELPADDLSEAHRILKEDNENNSKNCVNVTYSFEDEIECQTLGKFYSGLYNDRHDIALIKLPEDLCCQDHNTFLNENKIEQTLASKLEVMEKIERMRGSVPVRIFGSVTKNGRGNLIGINGMAANGGMNEGFYRIRGVDEEVFAEKGDSGALVYMICEDGKKIPFAYLSNVNDKGEYYCGNLEFSLRRINSEVIPCLGHCGRVTHQANNI